MSHLAIYKDNRADTTAVSNAFIDEYMSDANDAQIKVYLYLLRMLGAGQATSVSDLADKFNHTEKDILRALKYWERKKLLCVDYDASGIPVSIRFHDLSSYGTRSTRGGQSRPEETASTRAITMSAAEEGDATEPAAPATQPVLKRVPAPSEVAKPSFAKPSYSADDVRSFMRSGNASQLLFIAETYIGRPLTPAEMKSLLFFTDVLGFSDDLIDYLLQYCVGRDKKDFKYIEKVAVNWAEKGVKTPEDASRVSSRYEKDVYTVLNALGRTSSPTAREADYVTRWTKEYGFDMDIILEACDRTVLATDRHRLEYVEGILSKWKDENVRHKADILRMDEAHQKKKSSPKPSGSSAGKFGQFQQNDYDFAGLEKKILSN